MPEVVEVRAVTRLFKALGDPTRLQIVGLLAHGELCVCHLEKALKLSQPAVSRHLSVLRNGGVVEPHRAGSWVFYRLAPQTDPDCQKQLRALGRAFSKDSAARSALARLVKACGPEACR